MKKSRIFMKLVDKMTPKQLIKFIQNKTGVKYHITHVCRIMHSWNLCPKVPQKIHFNAVPVSEYRKCRRCVSLAKKMPRGKDFSVFVQDESVFFNNARAGKKYWIHGSERLVLWLTSKNHRLWNTE